jgi:heat-inducible transcriptional repressor
MITLPIIMGIEEEMGEYAFLVNSAVKCIYEVMNEIDGGDMRLAGINNFLKYPEYSDTEKLSELLGTLESRDEILDLVSGSDNDKINVLIGSESSVKVMNNSSLVYIPIKKDGKTLGVIGVIGPRRMNYKQVLKALGDISDNISIIIGDEELSITDGKEKESK